MRATVWSLDEFAVADGFGAFVPPEPPAPEPSIDEIEATFESRLADERARVEAAAYDRGRADGENEARAAMGDAIATAMAMLSDAVTHVQSHEARWVSHAEENIAALAVMVARHIVQREVHADPSFVSELVERAMAQYPLDQEITIRINPEDLVACRTSIDDHGRRELRWISDASILRGGCLMEGRERIIDGRVDTALERAYRSLGGVQA